MEGEPHAHEYINWKINGRIYFSIEAAAAAAGAPGANDDSLMQVDSPLQQEQELGPGN